MADVYISKHDLPAEARLDSLYEPDFAIAGNEHRYKITFGNNGWSVARDVNVFDDLDIMIAPDILGEVLVRCEPLELDTDDAVTCTGPVDGVVTVTSMQVDNESILPDGALSPGQEYSFYLIVQVDEGYVLDPDDFIALNSARIETTTTDFRGGGGGCFVDGADGCVIPANNADTELTWILSEADLDIKLSDTELPENGLAAASEADAATDVADEAPADVEIIPTQAFLTCDPVEPGGMLIYQAVVRNLGPSDARGVVATIWLPQQGVALDPEQVMVEVNEGAVLEVRDDGRIVVAVGRDPSTPLSNVNGAVPAPGPDELGRLNDDSFAVIDIQAMVALTAECGSTLHAHATVETMQTFDADLGGGNSATAFLDPVTRELWYVAEGGGVGGATSVVLRDGLLVLHSAPAPPAYGSFADRDIALAGGPRGSGRGLVPRCDRGRRGLRRRAQQPRLAPGLARQLSRGDRELRARARGGSRPCAGAVQSQSPARGQRGRRCAGRRAGPRAGRRLPGRGWGGRSGWSRARGDGPLEPGAPRGGRHLRRGGGRHVRGPLPARGRGRGPSEIEGITAEHVIGEVIGQVPAPR